MLLGSFFLRIKKKLIKLDLLTLFLILTLESLFITEFIVIMIFQFWQQVPANFFHFVHLSFLLKDYLSIQKTKKNFKKLNFKLLLKLKFCFF